MVFADGVITYTDNPKKFAKRLQELRSEFSKVSGFKVKNLESYSTFNLFTKSCQFYLQINPESKYFSHLQLSPGTKSPARLAWISQVPLS